MQLNSAQYIGYAVTIKTNLTGDDLDFFLDFISKHSEYDQWKKKGKVLLILDCMNQTYARLVFIDVHMPCLWTKTEEDYIVLRNSSVPEEVYNELSKPYKMMYGKDLDKNLIQHAIWFERS